MMDGQRIIVCVDDTDDVTKSTSTGKVAEEIVGQAERLGGTIELGVTRHQLLLDERVPYTSHNSSMAFVVRLPRGHLDALAESARTTVHRMMAGGSDPGLCIACLPDAEDDPFVYELVAFGQLAKVDYVAKSQAYNMAARVPWVSLEELGGDGQGVVGALAGVGLRLSGSDGRFRGRWNLAAVCSGSAGAVAGKRGKGTGRGDGSGGGHGRGDGSGGGRTRKQKAGGVEGAPEYAPPAAADGVCAYSAGRIREAIAERAHGRVLVVDEQGRPIPDDALVVASDDAKPVLYAGCLAIVTEMGEDGLAHPCSKVVLDELGGRFADLDRSCALFEFDNDLEELGAVETARACPNCLYRRWTSGGFTCMKRVVPARAFSQVVA